MKRRKETEEQALERVASEYRAAGFDVVLRPSGGDLPAFLDGFEPDAVAHGPNEHVVLELKSAASLARSTQLTSLAERVNQQPGWRLELVVQPLLDDPAREAERESRQYEALDDDEIRARLKSARLLSSHKDRDSALLVAWVALEAALRRLAIAYEIPIARQARPYLLKTLVAQGAITRKDFQQLEKSLHIRNLVAHGHRPARFGTSTIESVIALTERLLNDPGLQRLR